MVLDFAAFFAVLAVLVLAHELGHFLFARRFGVRVEEFGFGFPPRLGGIQKGETLYSFNVLPLGGFVKISGEDAVQSDDPRNFAAQPISARASILAAGILFNFILAYGLFAAALTLGVPVSGESVAEWPGQTTAEIVVTEVVPHSAAEAAGIHVGDTIKTLVSGSGESEPAGSVQSIQQFVSDHRGEPMRLSVERGGAAQELSVAELPREMTPGEGILGVAMTPVGIVRVPWYAIPWAALKMTVLTFIETARGIVSIIGLWISGAQVSGMVSGPVGIFSIVAQTLKFGAAYFLTLVAMLSVNLAIINVIPFPGLDGGRLLFLAIEKVRGRAPSARTARLAHSIGFAILIALMVVVTYYDVRLHL